MNAKQILSISALALVAPVFAQTVPAEAWVGAPLHTVSAASRDDVTAAFFAARAEASAPQELRVGPASTPTGALTSAEVAADLNLWIRSGMAQVAGQENFDPNAPAFRAQLAVFEQMRNGPAFVAELQRIRHGGLDVITSAQLEDGAVAR